MKTLLIMRHGKAEDAALGRLDRERPLVPRGERESVRMADELAAHGLVPDIVIASAAIRAHRTAELVAERLVSRVFHPKAGSTTRRAKPTSTCCANFQPRSVRRCWSATIPPWKNWSLDGAVRRWKWRPPRSRTSRSNSTTGRCSTWSAVIDCCTFGGPSSFARANKPTRQRIPRMTRRLVTPPGLAGASLPETSEYSRDDSGLRKMAEGGNSPQ